MPTTLRNTDILFNDGSTQSTAAALVPSSYGAVGTIVIGMLQVPGANTTLAEGSTVSGSNIRRWSDAGNGADLIQYLNFASFDTASGQLNINSFWNSLTSLGLSGTWRTLTRTRFSATFEPTTRAYAVLLQRIS